MHYLMQLYWIVNCYESHCIRNILSLKHFSISMQIQKEIIVIEMFQRTFLFNDLIRGHSYQGMCWPLMKRRSRLNEAKRNIFKVILSFTTLQSFYIEDIIFLDHTNGLNFMQLSFEHICPTLNVILPLMHQSYYII